MFRTLFVASAAALALSACATPGDTGSASTRDCFRAIDVSGYGVVDQHNVRVTVSPQREYILTVPGNTRDLDWTHAISIRSVTSFVCVGEHPNVQLMGGDPPMPYQVTRITRAPQTAPTGS
jgi:hypothetical protein